MNIICGNVSFTILKHYFCNFQGIPNPLRNRSHVPLTTLLPTMNHIYENASKLGPIRDSKIYRKSLKIDTCDLLSAPEWPLLSQMSIQSAKMMQKGIKNAPQNTQFGHHHLNGNRGGENVLSDQLRALLRKVNQLHVKASKLGSIRDPRSTKKKKKPHAKHTPVYIFV